MTVYGGALLLKMILISLLYDLVKFEIETLIVVSWYRGQEPAGLPAGLYTPFLAYVYPLKTPPAPEV